MEWVMFAFVVAIAVKSFEMARSLRVLEEQVQTLSRQLRAEAEVDARRTGFAHRETVDD